MLGSLAPIEVQAAVNSQVSVSNLQLVKSSRSGVDAPGQRLTAEDVAKLTYDWDATNADVTSGESFSIDLGTSFKNLQYPMAADMTVTYNGASVVIGSCALTETLVTCTFNDKVDELKAAGFTGFKGRSQALLLITRSTTAEAVDMTVNGSQTVSVDLPGTGGISGVVPTTYVPLRLSKMSSVIGPTSSSMVWEVNFGTPYITQ